MSSLENGRNGSKKGKKTNIHHSYPKRIRRQNGNSETKIVIAREHSAWHQIVGSKSPDKALLYIVRNFLPEKYYDRIKEAIR